MYSEVIKLIKTPSEAQTLVWEIEAVEGALYRGGDALAQVLGESVRGAVAQAIKSEVGERSWQEYLGKLKEKVLGMKTMELVVAFDPPSESVENIVSRARLLWGDILVEIVVNPKIVGGALISFNGVYRDLSLRSAADDWFEKRAK